VGQQSKAGAIVRIVDDLLQGESGLGALVLGVAISAVGGAGKAIVETGYHRQLGGHLLMAGQAAVAHVLVAPEGRVALAAVLTQISVAFDTSQRGLA
jgi:hypothetical protein